MIRLPIHRFRATSIFVFTGAFAIALVATKAAPAISQSGTRSIPRRFQNGEVPVAGGESASSKGKTIVVASAELYTP